MQEHLIQKHTSNKHANRRERNYVVDDNKVRNEFPIFSKFCKKNFSLFAKISVTER